MSDDAAVRQLLADAASTVEGVTCATGYRQLSKKGDAAVRMDRIEYPDPFGGVVTWQVWISLGADLAAGEVFLGDKRTALKEALDPHMNVRAIRIEQIVLGTSVVPCFVVEGQREG